jgi:uncharacterized protein YutE (UPF0331/DUF86 family)
MSRNDRTNIQSERRLNQIKKRVVSICEADPDDEIVYGVFRKNLSDFDLFVERIATFLNKTP